MIADKIKNIGLYMGYSDRLDKGFRIIAQADLADKEDGKYEVDGDTVLRQDSTLEPAGEEFAPSPKANGL